MKPCPFCGEKNYLDVYQGGAFRVGCSKCKSNGPVECSVGKAKKAWNKRPQENNGEPDFKSPEMLALHWMVNRQGYQPRPMKAGSKPPRSGSGVPRAAE